MEDRRRVTRSPAGPLHRTAAVVHIALAVAATGFGLVGWGANRTGMVASMALPEARVLLYVWLALLALATLLAVKMWHARAEALGRGDGPAMAPESLLSLLLPLWAVIAAPAVFGVILFLVAGAPLLLAGSLLYLWIGFWLTRPKRHWFGDTDPESGRPA